MQSTAEGLDMAGERWATLQVFDDNTSKRKVMRVLRESRKIP